ncbi:MAG: 2-C-methyl-D-erythritol 4-phosphate cytidylyltransferase [Erysipelotrichaceae bacterium]|nr:2-C-methyl-D-erythritol 4-phosphate cytidylyltransferase [Erysipelotrichaceae bacterium]
MNYSVIIVAAGKSTRFGQQVSKILYQFSDGEKVIEKTLKPFISDDDCKQIVLVTSEEVHEYLKDGCPKTVFCRGGNSRQESVYNGLLNASEKYVLVHDGARCFLEREDLENLKNEINENQGALLVKSVTDTIKIAENGYVSETIDREKVKRAQTPQGFPRKVLLQCYEKAFKEDYLGTDDCSLVERYSDLKIKCVESKGDNIKITTFNDVMGGK